jgi:signal transduction histidine kinase
MSVRTIGYTWSCRRYISRLTTCRLTEPYRRDMSVGDALTRRGLSLTALRMPPVSDVLLAVAITVTSQLELRNDRHGTVSVAYALALLGQTGPLAWRRIAPASAVTVGALALAAEALLLTPGNTLSGLVAGLVLVYSAARHVPAQRRAATGVLIVSAVAVHRAATRGNSASDIAFDAVFVAAAWAVGTVLRRRHEEVAAIAAERDDTLARQSEREQNAIAAERARIARELHDVVAHSLSLIVVQAGAAESVLTERPTEATVHLTAVRDAARDALAEMRRLLGLLRLGPADDESGSAGIDHIAGLVEQARVSGQLVTLALDRDLPALPAGISSCVYRIVQEALTNARKHASGACVEIDIKRQQGRLQVRIHDNGTTIGKPAMRGGHGLVGMHERARLYGGQLRAGPDEGGGFTVAADLPVTSAHLP